MISKYLICVATLIYHFNYVKSMKMFNKRFYCAMLFLSSFGGVSVGLLLP